MPWQFKQKRILIIGDVMLDRYWHGVTERISQEAPVPVVQLADQKMRVGGAANTAANVQALGGKVSLLGITGADQYSQLIRDELDKKSIQANLVQCQHNPTIVKTRVLGGAQQLLRIDQENRFSAQAVDKLYAVFQEVLVNTDAVIISDYQKGTMPEPDKLITAAKKAGKPVFVDPKLADLSAYAGADVVKPNEKECLALLGQFNTTEELVPLVRQALSEYNINAFLVTRGARGMVWITQTDVIEFPAHMREVYDVTGAGDTVIATFVTALTSDLSYKKAVELSNLAASLAVSKIGTVQVSQDELQQAEAIYTQPSLRLSSETVVTETVLLDYIHNAKKSGEKIVFTNGCFDILHPGHVQYLEEAKQLGDRLIIGVNTDESVSALKGPSRPINTLSTRMMMLGALRSVDWVVAFSESTPTRLIESLSPDVLVKGGDYTDVNALAGAQHVQATGGEVKILSLAPNQSTTNIIDKIQSQSQTAAQTIEVVEE